MTVSIREKPPLRLHYDVIATSGRHYRWADDEPDPENVPSAVSFSSSMPGGFDQFSAVLPRKPGVDYPDLARLSTIRCLGVGAGVAGEYRIERAPRDSSLQRAINPIGRGWQAHLEDNSGAREIYCERDVGGWTTPASYQRHVNLMSGATRYLLGLGTASVEPDDATPAVRIGLTRLTTSATGKSYAETWYDASDIAIGSVYWGYRDADSANGALNPASWEARLSLSDDDLATTLDQTADLAGGTSTGTLTATGAAKKYAIFSLIHLDTFTGDDDWKAYLRRPAVFGAHGLAKRGTAPDEGLYASDVIANAVSRWAPRLKFTTGSEGTIKPTSFVIPQLAFKEPTTVAAMLQEANRFHLNDWAVWEGQRPGEPTFYYHERGARGRKWRARVAPSQLKETGPQMDQVWNGVIVSFQDVDGTTKLVGPTGSGLANTSGDLIDTDTENPANKLGIRRWTQLSMNGISTAAGATEVGRRFLVESKQLDASGEAQLVGYVEDDRGVTHPYWKVRAGDSIAFVDAADKSYRRIVRADNNVDARTCNVTLDSPPEGMVALLERLQAVLVPLGF